MRRFLMLLFTVTAIPYLTTLAWTGRLEIAQAQPSGFSERADEKKIIVTRNGHEFAVSAEEFLTGVLAAQIPARYGPETIRAQAVLARTYIYREMDGRTEITEEELDLDVLDRPAMERLWGSDDFAETYEKFEQAVKETAGIAVMYGGEFIKPFFCLAASGKTRSRGEEYPYLKQAESPGDTELDGFLDTELYSGAQLAAKIGSIPGAAAVSADMFPKEVQIVERDGAGYVLKIQIGGKTYTGEEIQAALGLPSSCFSFDEYKGKIRVTTKGSGHGYGFSQTGANALERDGYGWRDLLEYYFQGIEIENIL